MGRKERIYLSVGWQVVNVEIDGKLGGWNFDEEQKIYIILKCPYIIILIKYKRGIVNVQRRSLADTNLKQPIMTNNGTHHIEILNCPVECSEYRASLCWTCQSAQPELIRGEYQTTQMDWHSVVFKRL